MNSDPKTIVITGGTSGIGRALTEHFAREKYRVIFTGRNREKAKSIVAAHPQADLHFIEADFSSLKSTEHAAETITSTYGRIDILINNAGTWEMQFRETADGIETNFAVNQLAPMLFTLKLLPFIGHGTGRIINTSSGAHRRNILELDDPEWRNKPYDGVATYSQSKLCNILFTAELANRIEGTGILVNTVHPGFVKTNLFDNMGSRNWEGVPDAAQGARSAIFAATDNKIVNTSKLYIYHENTDSAITDLARNEHAAALVWDLSMKYLRPYLNETPITNTYDTAKNI